MWYQSSALEADYYRQKAQNKHKKMALDPRTHQPFRDENAFIPVSGRSLQIGMDHYVLHYSNIRGVTRTFRDRRLFTIS